MKVKGFSVFDKAANAFLPLFFMPTRGMALRSFTDAVNDPAHQFGKEAHYGDYALFEMCEFDDADGSFLVSSDQPLRLASAIDVKVKIA